MHTYTKSLRRPEFPSPPLFSQTEHVWPLQRTLHLWLRARNLSPLPARAGAGAAVAAASLGSRLARLLRCCRKSSFWLGVFLQRFDLFSTSVSDKSVRDIYLAPAQWKGYSAARGINLVDGLSTKYAFLGRDFLQENQAPYLSVALCRKLARPQECLYSLEVA